LPTDSDSSDWNLFQSTRDSLLRRLNGHEDINSVLPSIKPNDINNVYHRFILSKDKYPIYFFVRDISHHNVLFCELSDARERISNQLFEGLTSRMSTYLNNAPVRVRFFKYNRDSLAKTGCDIQNLLPDIDYSGSTPMEDLEKIAKITRSYLIIKPYMEARRNGEVPIRFEVEQGYEILSNFEQIRIRNVFEDLQNFEVIRVDNTNDCSTSIAQLLSSYIIAARYFELEKWGEASKKLNEFVKTAINYSNQIQIRPTTNRGALVFAATINNLKENGAVDISRADELLVDYRESILHGTNLSTFLNQLPQEFNDYDDFIMLLSFCSLYRDSIEQNQNVRTSIIRLLLNAQRNLDNLLAVGNIHYYQFFIAKRDLAFNLHHYALNDVYRDENLIDFWDFFDQVNDNGIDDKYTLSISILFDSIKYLASKMDDDRLDRLFRKLDTMYNTQRTFNEQFRNHPLFQARSHEIEGILNGN